MDQSTEIITRFAPSPTGYLHLGHAYSAKLSYDFAKKNDGVFLLRIEDIDQGRCKAEYEDAIFEDLAWVGLSWEEDVRRQSDHMDDYKKALNFLRDQGLLYPCFCTRKDIRREIEESGRAPHDLTEHSTEGPLYPGTCRSLSASARHRNLAQEKPFALRLNMEKALKILGDKVLTWTDLEAGKQVTTPEVLHNTIGDAVLARKDIPTSYHLSVVVDDHLQNISHIIRGQDLFLATHLHRLLQFLLGYNTPIYHHHDLLTDEQGWRYAKRNHSKTLKLMRENGEELTL